MEHVRDVEVETGQPAIVAERGENGARQRLVGTDGASDENRCLGKCCRLLDVDAHVLAHDVGELFDDGGVVDQRMGSEELLAGRQVRKSGERRDLLSAERRLLRTRGHGGPVYWKPFFRSWARSFWRHRPRMKPIDPHDISSRSAISLYGRAGDSKKSI